MTNHRIIFRPAKDEDREWLWTLKRATMREYVAAVFGWEDEAQRRMFEAKFEPARLRIIQSEGRDVGLLEYEERADHFFLARLEILPVFQNRGIGSAVIGAVIETAQAEAKGVRLQVLRSNPARRLYERLGFLPEEETATHCRMRREPGPPSAPARPHQAVHL